METPPPFAPQQKKSNTGLIIGLILGGVGLCCIGGVVLGGLGIFGLVKSVMPIAECTVAYATVGKAVRDYAQDHDGRLPKAETWQDDVSPYYEKEAQKKENQGIKPMDFKGLWGCKQGSEMTGMAFNSDLSGKKIDDIKDQYMTIMVFETESASKNAHEVYKPRDPNKSPKIFGAAPRGWFVISADGTPRMISPNGTKPVDIRTRN